MPKPFQTERALEIAVGVVLVGVVLTIISLLELTLHNVGLGNWADWTIVVGLLVFLLGAYLLATFLKLSAQFDRYMKIDSRAEFKKELDEIEYTAWRLPSRYDRRLTKRKEELGMK